MSWVPLGSQTLEVGGQTPVALPVPATPRIWTEFRVIATNVGEETVAEAGWRSVYAISNATDNNVAPNEIEVEDDAVIGPFRSGIAKPYLVLSETCTITPAAFADGLYHIEINGGSGGDGFDIDYTASGAANKDIIINGLIADIPGGQGVQGENVSSVLHLTPDDDKLFFSVTSVTSTGSALTTVHATTELVVQLQAK